MATLDELNAQLEQAAKLLDGTAGMIRDLESSPHANIRRIGEALASVFEIQHQILVLRPDLTPEEPKPPR